MIQKNSVWAFVALAGLMTVSAVAQTTTTSTHTASSGLVGFGPTQSVEVDILNTASNSTTGTAASCAGTVSFINSSGATIGTATPFTLASGQLQQVRQAFNTSGATGNRAVVRALISLTVPAATPRPPCSLSSTVEIIDTTTNATQVVVSGGDIAGYRN